ncbi:hypothetical protein PGH26_13625 [Sporosarcina jeotgali]|uniref:Uncharacterized protein n=1 Tax=Sporosarcina jeotgali TaxID=3020056 RepID=A0ABZ0KTZ1_9BACL|nr:hypothetical protein [Sporosarcina sp. B2O-1]WOV83904.1 hypothetical protein PGH26_13625 [Sporosarcina sp. B2O-1]
METKQIGIVKSEGIEFPVAFGMETLYLYQKNFKRSLDKDLQQFGEQATQGTFDHGKYHIKALQIVWAFAKSADPKIKRPKTWMKQFVGHSPYDIFVQVEKLLVKEVS